MSEHDRISFDIPPWLSAINEQAPTIPDPVGRMEFVIAASTNNVVRGGGPFAAAIFDVQSHQLISLGVNLVLQQKCSVLHAEMVAIMLAQRQCGAYDLNFDGRARELVSSSEPCAMCFGAIPWAGLRRLVCGSRDSDARRIGFDEGAKVSDWSAALRRRGIEVVEDLCRDQAAAVLDLYAERGGDIYHPH
ncbi:MAG: nucleoside deaminase [Caulobacteraceae bacterium]|nr:nucleoside deaminase [Caulobacteraceae bacterium]